MTISPLNMKNTLLNAPKSAPRYSVEVDGIKLGDPKATRALLLLMNQHAVSGGAACHWGGPSAMAETMSALHGIMFKHNDWYNHFNFVNDIGHAENGIYALRANLGYGDLTFEALKKFRSIESNLTGHGESHLYPEGVLLSNGPLGSALPQAQGLALADALSGKTNRITIAVVSDGAAMEGEAKEAFAAIPGLAQKNKLAPFLMIISDNNTKLSGRIDKDSFSMTPSFEALKALGWRVETIADGHDLAAVYKKLNSTISECKNKPTQPIALIIKTIKGKGLKSTEESASGGHGYPLGAYDAKLMSTLSEIYAGESNIPAEFKSWAQSFVAPEKKTSTAAPTEKIQVGIANAMIKAAKAGLPVFSVSSDLAGSTGVSGFQKEFPTHTLDVGIAESNMVSVAAGLSRAGFIPVVDTFAAFGITKGNLPLIMANLSQSPVIAIFSHTGYQDAADGASHQSTTYFSATASIPYTDIYQPSCSSEAEFYLTQVINNFKSAREAGKTPNSAVFFIGRENFPKAYNDAALNNDGCNMIQTGSDVVLLASGATVPNALEAAAKLKERNISAAVVSLVKANGELSSLVVELIKKVKKVITVEDHQIKLGLGAHITHELKLKNVDFKISSLGMHGHFGRSAYKASELYKMSKMDAGAIVESVGKL
jgi:transketolase